MEIIEDIESTLNNKQQLEQLIEESIRISHPKTYNQEHKKIIGLSPHRHEVKGIRYLLSIGYKEEDIKLNTIKGYKDAEGSGKADITTINDNQQWEVKVLSSSLSWIKFTSTQFKKFTNDINILIFHNNGKFIENIKFGDIKNDIKTHSNHANGIYTYRFIVTYEVDFNVAEKFTKILDITNNNIAFMLSGSPKELIREFINTHSEGYIRQIIDDEDLNQLYNFEYTSELLDEKYNEKKQVIDKYSKENFPEFF